MNAASTAGGHVDNSINANGGDKATNEDKV